MRMAAVNFLMQITANTLARGQFQIEFFTSVIKNYLGRWEK
jgi:hypothetical protein